MMIDKFEQIAEEDEFYSDTRYPDDHPESGEGKAVDEHTQAALLIITPTQGEC
jgi:hypothetical protein